MSDTMGLNRENGRAIYDWNHVTQCTWLIFTTSFATRVMLRTFGSAIPVLLGRMNLTELTLALFWMAIYAAMDPVTNQYGAINGEPRFRIRQILYPTPQNNPLLLREGQFAFQIVGTYFPRALSGDTTPGPVQRTISINFPYTIPQ